MAPILLKLELKRPRTAGTGTIDDFMRNLKLDESAHPNTIDAMTIVEDDSRFVRIFTPTNRALIDWIRENKPESIYAMAKALKKDLSNLSKVLEELSFFCLVRIERGATVRYVHRPRVDWDILEVRFHEPLPSSAPKTKRRKKVA